VAEALIFWIVFGVVGFALALGLQMRVLVAKVLRMAAKAKFPEASDADLVLVVKATPDHTEALPPGLTEISVFLKHTYDGAVRHLTLARRSSTYLPVLLLIVVFIGRFVLGVI